MLVLCRDGTTSKNLKKANNRLTKLDFASTSKYLNYNPIYWAFLQDAAFFKIISFFIKLVKCYALLCINLQIMPCPMPDCMGISFSIIMINSKILHNFSNIMINSAVKVFSNSRFTILLFY